MGLNIFFSLDYFLCGQTLRHTCQIGQASKCGLERPFVKVVGPTAHKCHDSPFSLLLLFLVHFFDIRHERKITQKSTTCCNCVKLNQQMKSFDRSAYHTFFASKNLFYFQNKWKKYRKSPRKRVLSNGNLDALQLEWISKSHSECNIENKKKINFDRAHNTCDAIKRNLHIFNNNSECYDAHWTIVKQLKRNRCDK